VADNQSMPLASPPAQACRRGALSALALLVAACLGLAAPSARADTPVFAGASADADTVFFTTAEKVVSGDTDFKQDVYQRSYEASLGIYVTREASTGPTGGNDAFDVGFDGVSEDGRVVFFSTSESLVGADSDKAEDVYARLASGTTLLLSEAAVSCTAPSCGNANTDASFSGATADGSRVFFSTDEKLAAEDGDGSFDVYARTLAPASTVLVSRPAAACGAGCGDGSRASIFGGASTDGGKVVFTTTEPLDPGDTDLLQDLYQRDLGAGTTTLLSSAGSCAVGVNCDAVYRGSSETGDRVFFQSSERIGSGDNDDEADVYAWSGGAVALVSSGDPSCAGSNCGNNAQPTSFAGSSADGRRVFLTSSEPLVAADGDGATDLYVRDLDAAGTELVSTAGTCPAAVDCNAVYRGSSADGGLVLFQTAERAGPGDNDSATDVYVRDLDALAPELVSVPAPGCVGSCGDGALEARFSGVTADGESVFFSTAESLSPGDADEAIDVYSHDVNGAGTTALLSPAGICPLAEEEGCDASFEAAAADGSAIVFSSVERLSSEDVDSILDIYQRAAGKTRLLSIGNSIELGPATPILTGTNPASPNISTEPSLLGHASASTSIKVYPTSDCSGAPAATGSSAALEAGGIGVPVPAGSTTTLRATATNESGDTSACSVTAIAYTQAADVPADGGGGGGDESGGGGGGPDGGSGTSGGTAPTPAPTAGTTPVGAGRAGPGVAARHEVPQTRITFAPASKTRVRRPVFRFTDSTEQSGTNFLCKVDRHAWFGCSSPLRLKRLPLGAHAFHVKGLNSGLAEPRPVVRKFRVVGG
jgi:hypothetical protein